MYMNVCKYDVCMCLNVCEYCKYAMYRHEHIHTCYANVSGESKDFFM